MRWIGTMAMGAAVLAGVGGLGLTARAQAADAPAVQAPVAPVAQQPVVQAPVAPAAQTPAAPADASSLPTVSAVAPGGTIFGTVKAGGVPLPGVSVTAKNTLTGKTYATTTDVDGKYKMAIPANGRYVVKAELAAFSAPTDEVVVNSMSQNGGLPMEVAEFNMQLASRAPAPTETTVASGVTAPGTPGTPATPGVPGARATVGTRAGMVARQGRGTQVVAVQGGDDPSLEDANAGGGPEVSIPSLGGIGGGDDAGSAAADTVAVSGVPGQTNGLGAFSQSDLEGRIGDMQRQGFNTGDIATAFQGAMNGQGFGGPGGGFGGQGGGFGGPGGGGGGFGGGGGGGFGGGGGRGGGGGGRGGGGGGGFGGGGFRGQNPNQPHGSIAYNGSDSVLNAQPYSVTGFGTPKANSDTNNLTISVTGTPYIPGLTTPNPKQFVFLSVQETRNTVPTLFQGIVPTALQRLGDLSTAGAVYDPSTGQQYVNNGNCLPALYALNPTPTACIPQNEISSAGTALLNYYPLPNVTSVGTLDNYQTNTTRENHQEQISARYNRSFGAAPVRGQRGGGGGRVPGGARTTNRNAPPTLRQSIAENFAYSHAANSSTAFSPLLGGSGVTNGYSFTSGYTIGYGRLNNTATVGWNRSLTTNSNYFTNTGTNPAVAAGIFVGNPTIYSNKFYAGLPSVSLTGNSGLTGLSDSQPSSTVNQTITISEQLRWSHKRHNTSYGFDFHRIHADSIGGTSVLGSFTFSGFATEGTAAQQANTGGGSPIADLLLGLPQQTGVTAGLSKIYLRGNSWDWFAQDDWRARSGLTFQYGMRWEYFSPYSEKYNHLVNLDVNGSGSALAISNVCATAAAGCAAVGTPASLVNPDKSMYSPRIAVAWVPHTKFSFTKLMVVRSSYAINYNTGQYSRMAQLLSTQQPFSVTQNNTLTTTLSPTTCIQPSQVGTVQGTPMTLANGFNCSTQTTQSNYGVNPRYRLGMVQAYNLGIQKQLPQGIVLNVDYTGAYAGNLDIVRLPNRNATQILNPSSGQFRYEDSLGYLRSNALAVNLRMRQHKGISLGGTYTYSHSIDDAGSVGGSGSSAPAQNDADLGAEESNSAFDHRHSLTGTWIIELPFGPNRAFLNKGGVWARIMDGYSISGNYTFSTGGFATPYFSQLAAEVATGAGSSLRPNRVPGQPITGVGSLKSWFNTAAFAPACILPTATDPNPVNSPYCLQPGTFGTSGRNSIELPGTVLISGSLSRTITLGDTRSVEFRLNANNALNTVQYSGVSTQVNGPQFGQVTSAAGMRSLTYRAQFRF